ncbi:MAG: hypothetical protein ABSH29_14225 [Acidimicrobiales bacterium]|jgi:hypothetical protein
MPTIHARGAFRLHRGQLISQILGGLANGAGTAAAEADRCDYSGPGEQGGREPKEGIIAGMGSSSQPRLG